MSTAAERGDLAESLIPVASELTFLVRDEGREAIGEWMDAHDIPEGPVRALLVVLAARSSVDITDEQAYDWITWDEDGRPLEQTIPLLPCVPVSVPGPDRVPARLACRREEYAELRSQGLNQKEAVARMGIHRRSAARYEAQLRAQREGKAA